MPLRGSPYYFWMRLHKNTAVQAKFGTASERHSYLGGRRLRREISARLFSIRLLIVLALSVFGAIRPAIAQEDDADFGMTGIMIGGDADIRHASSVLPHSPAAEAEIEKGDTILAIDGVGVAGLELAEFIAKMRGKPGSEVVLLLMSHKTGVAFSVTLKRVSFHAYHEANPTSWP